MEIQEGMKVWVPRTAGGESLAEVKGIIPACEGMGPTLAHCVWEEKVFAPFNPYHANRPNARGRMVNVLQQKWVEVGKLTPYTEPADTVRNIKVA